MFKKIVLAAALAVSASFATWDYFPVLEAGKGSAEIGMYYDWHDDWSQAGLKAGARYSLFQNFELALMGLGYQFWSETDCDGCYNGGDGFRDLVIGARYQVAPMITAALDLGLPVGGKEVSSDEIYLYGAVQFSTQFPSAPGLALGSEAGIFWGFEHDNFERGLEIHVGAEVDYTIANVGVTPFLGLQFKGKFTEDTWDDGKHGADNGAFDDKQIIIWLGAAYAIDPMFTVKAQLFVRSGDQDMMGGDASGLYAACDINF